MIDKIGVHASHCCVVHGCKYGDDNCPVVLKEVKQKYVCEYCNDIEIENLNDLEKYINMKNNLCCNDMKKLFKSIDDFKLLSKMEICPFCKKTIYKL